MAEPTSPNRVDALVAEAIAPPTSSVIVPRSFLRRLLRKPVAVICLVYIAALIVVAIVAPIAMPNISRQFAGNLLASKQGPSAQHLLGTDTLGRDVLDRLLVGTQVTLIGVAEGVGMLLILGLPMGLWIGYLGGWVDRAMNWLADLTFSLPAVVLLILVLSVFPESLTAAMLTFGVIASPGLMRVVRSVTLSIREEAYIDAAKVSGVSTPRVVSRHILPRVAGPVIVQTALFAAVALLIESGLSFLQLVIAAPAPSWGGMITDGVSVIDLQPWLIVPPGVAIGLTVLAFGLLGDAVRDASAERWATSPMRRRRFRPPAQSSPTTGPGTAMSGSNVASARRGDLLSVRDLDVTFALAAGEARVIQDVSFEVSPGETLGIVGESGSGKTVTALALIGMLPGSARITNGNVMFGGADLAAMSERELRRIRGKEIALISQEPMVSLDPVFKVGHQVAEAVRHHHSVSRKAARERTLGLLDAVRMPNPRNVADRYPHELSGGMLQRVAIARAIAGEPQLLIADEPTTALDVTVQSEILDLLYSIQADRGMSMLLITHDWGVVADTCDRVLVMYAGQIVESSDLEPVFRRPYHPYTEALLASNPHGAPVGEPLPTIVGTVPPPQLWPQSCHFAPRCRYADCECTQGPVQLRLVEDDRQSRCVHVAELVQAGATR